MTDRFSAANQAIVTPDMLAATIRVTGQEGVFLIKGVARKLQP